MKKIGSLLFRTRNTLFPALLVALLITFPPERLGLPIFDALAWVGLFIALCGQALRVLAIGLDYIKRGGKRKRIYADRLVTGGLYAHTRNPMYIGNLLIALGALMVAGNPWALAIGGGLVVFAYSAIVAGEEAYLIDRFGDQYLAYTRRTPRWLLKPRRLGATIAAFRFDWRGVVVKEYSTLFTTAMMLTVIVAVKAWRADVLNAWAPMLVPAIVLWIGLFTVARYLKKRRGWRARGRSLRDDTIDAARRRIDLIDVALLDLLNQRAIEVGAIFQWKDASGVPRVDIARMNQMLERLTALNPGPLTQADAHALLSDIIQYFAYKYRPASELESSAEFSHAPYQAAVAAEATTGGATP